MASLVKHTTIISRHEGAQRGFVRRCRMAPRDQAQQLFSSMLGLGARRLAALAIMHFLVTWNDFLGPLIYISSPEQMTGSYALRLFQSANSGEWALLLAAATLWTLPVIALFFFAQRAWYGTRHVLSSQSFHPQR